MCKSSYKTLYEKIDKQSETIATSNTYLCSDSSCMKAWSASTASENDINKRNSCLNMQQKKNMVQYVSAYDKK